jgi:hypothetical protein
MAWPDDGPVHGAEDQRFAKHIDEHVETRATVASD